MRAAPGVGLAAPQIGDLRRVIVLEVCSLAFGGKAHPADAFCCGTGQDTAALMQKESRRMRKAKQRTPFELRVFVNPVLSFPTDEMVTFEEACLSIPGYAATVKRYQEVIVKGFDIDGAPVEWHAKGWAARILQHEVDHLDGKLYIDRAEAGSRFKVLPSVTDGEKPWMAAMGLVLAAAAWANHQRRALFGRPGD